MKQASTILTLASSLAGVSTAFTTTSFPISTKSSVDAAIHMTSTLIDENEFDDDREKLNTEFVSQIDWGRKYSKAIPGLEINPIFDGSMAGDVGFDPLGFVKTKEDLMRLREAEVKHGRLYAFSITTLEELSQTMKQVSTILTLASSLAGVSTAFTTTSLPISTKFSVDAAIHMTSSSIDENELDDEPEELDDDREKLNTEFVSQLDWGRKYSKAIPGLEINPIFDGSMAGDVGFDPLGFVKTKEDLMRLREAEVKHGRLAMLAAAGWPVSELFDRKIASLLGLPEVVDFANRAPSLLNGGLEKISLAYWASVFALAAAGWPVSELFDRKIASLLGLPEIVDFTNRAPSLLNGGLEKISLAYWASVFAIGAVVEYQNNKAANSKDNEGYFPGNIGFDPLNLYPKDPEGQKDAQLKEIKNGRLAMIAVLAYTAQEFVSQTGVIGDVIPSV
eukprot:CAMPEP_0194158828 /NCGR_PEP_ID=MMETSP0152-20130528/77492_1 /TAXON_ID=1049557 /ORGANISM="Thalassiothrix antarctica, Strain L6-D1" /LENGTH=448 /DNA_ID=CAMNT_0038868329 /DNA_START=76 /DNA_END=1422 /DNA_ORIENTATION=-